jgi:LEA14-like dessication related protein
MKNVEGELQSVRMKSLKGANAVVEVRVTINNPSSHNIHIKNGEFEILRDGYMFGTAILHQPVVVRRRSHEDVELLFDVKIIDRMAIMSGRIRAIIAGDDRTRLSLSGRLKVGTKLFSKSVPINFEY